MVNNIFILDEHLKTSKILTINGQNTFFDDIYTLDLATGTETYEFSTTITDIDESNYVMFYYHGKYKLFQIVEIEQEHDKGDIITTVYAETACLELLNDVVRSFEGEYNAISFLEHVLEGSSWSIGKYSSSLAEKVVSVKVDKTTQKWSCIQDYMGDFGYEISPYVIYDNGHVKSKVIDVYSEGELGELTYKRFEYGRNVSGIVKKKDLYEWCTALIIDTDKDVTNVTYDKDGYIKKAGSDVVLATNENSKYNLGRDYIYSNFEPQNCNDGTDAVAKTIEELKRRATPRFNYECTTALTYEEYDNLNLGDTVYCIDHTFSPSLTLEARIGKLELSFTDRTKCRCNLTNYKEVKSKINIELTGNIQQIIDSYFPITSESIANGAITSDKIDSGYHDQLVADTVAANRVVTEQLIAKEVIAIDGKFENLSATYATIENLEATNAKIDNLEVTDLTAVNAEIENLKANKAEITDLTATNANIANLNADVAHIGTLIGGNASIQDIQSIVLTSDNVTIANALIKDAMIANVSANKINAGTLNTNNVVIQSENGNMLLQGNLQQFKDNNGNVRIQIGQDTTGDFTFVLYGEDGNGILLDQSGIKASAISDGLIVDAMVSDGANIQAGKLDISSLFTEINGSTETIKSSKIYLDDKSQTLDVAFNSLSTTVENLKIASGDVGDLVEKVSSNTTSIQVQQGQIDTLIANTTITKADGTVVQLKDEYNSTKDTVNSHTTAIGLLETNYDKVTGDIAEVTSKQSTLEQNLEGFKTTVSNTYSTKEEVSTQISSITQTVDSITSRVSSTETKVDNSLSSTVAQYYVSTSATTQTGGSWIETTPTWSEGTYVWQRMKYTYTNNTVSYSTPVCIQGAKGEDGTGVNILGKYDSLAALNQAHPTGNIGDCYTINGTLYTWSTESNSWIDCGNIKGEQGEKGDTGEKGQSLTKSTPQWYASTSNTTQTGGSWVETMPTIDNSHYLWLRYKLDWENPTATTYTTPTLEQVAESVKVISNKQATLEQSLDGFKTTVSDTYATKNELTGEMTTIRDDMSQVEQTANKINWLVSSGSSSSDMTLTDELFNLVSSNITLTGEHIVITGDTSIEGLVTANEYFKILEDGTCTATDITLSGNLEANNLVGNYLNVPWHDRAFTRDIIVYINPSYTYSDADNITFDHEATFRSFADLKAAAPRNLNGYRMDIYLNADVTENIFLDNFNNGIIRVNMQGYSIKGYIACYKKSMEYEIFGNTWNSTGGSTKGSIVPGANGRLNNSYRYCITGDRCRLSVYDMNLYKCTATDYNSGGIICTSGCVAYLSGIAAINEPYLLVRAHSCSHVYVENSSGLTSNRAFHAVSGAIMIINDTNQCGTSIGNKTYTADNGQIFDTGATYGGTSTSGSITAPSANTTRTVTKVINSDTGRSWRTSGSYANSWSTDSIVRQGRWSTTYGSNTGYWFFGNDIYSILQNTNNTVTSIKIKITRNSGGQSAAVTHYLRAHTYGSKPSGSPSQLGTGVLNQSFSLAVGNSITVSLTSSQISNLISNRAKGFGLYTSSTAQSGYSCCSASATVTITYKTTE